MPFRLPHQNKYSEYNNQYEDNSLKHNVNNS